jgi:ethanolamine utilization protein EutQ (cupin superfamily)
MLDYRIAFGTLPWRTPIPGVRDRIFDREATRLRLVEYTPEMEPHWCDRGHVGMILEGEFEIRFPGSLEIFRPGDGLFIPSGEGHRHMARALTPKVTALFVEEV